MLLSEYLVVQKERDEALSEIARHHKDFERIRGVLDTYEALPRVLRSYMGLIRDIRGIVG